LDKIEPSANKTLKLTLSKLIKNIEYYIFFVDSFGYVTLVNDSASNWLKLKKYDMKGSKVQSLIEGIDCDDLDEALSEGRNYKKQLMINEIHYMVKYIPTIVGKKNNIGGIVVCKDIHDVKNDEDAIKELDAVINATSDSIYVTDGSGKTLRINSACSKITGLDENVVIGMNIRDVVAKGMISKSCTLEVLRTKSKVTILQKVRDGKVVLVTGTPLFNDHGNIWRVVSSTRDITELNRLKNELEDARRTKDQYYTELVEMRVKQMADGEGDFVANSAQMQKVIELAMRVARTDSTVLVRGESGVGKEVVTKFIHRNSTRNKNALMKINCAAIPEQLLESELFGHEPGAFTGAMKKGKIGLIELANHGTLFLDEIGEMSLMLQAKILQVIQERNFYRVGGTKVIDVDIRIIAATNRYLEKLVAEKKFREDLFYRINVIPIMIPSLKERTSDIVPLLQSFFKKFNKKYLTAKKISNEALTYLNKYQWPGNIRELENLVEQLVVITPVDLVEPQHLPNYIQDSFNKNNEQIINTPSGLVSLPVAMEEFEKRIFLSAYEISHNTYETASALGISQPTVVRKLKKYK